MFMVKDDLKERIFRHTGLDFLLYGDSSDIFDRLDKKYMYIIIIYIS